MRFPPLSKKQEIVYQKIKDEKRNLVAKEQMGISDEDEEKDPVDKAIEILENGRIRNSQVLDGMAMGDGKDPEAFKRTMLNRLKRQGKPHRLSEYYWENKQKGKKGKEQIAEWRSIFKG